MPRAGNTLFGSLLNQNPRVRVTANSIVSETMWITQGLKNDQLFDRFYVDFGAILAPNLAPKSLPKSCQTMLILTSRANLAPMRAQEAPRRLPKGLGDHFWTIFDQF